MELVSVVFADFVVSVDSAADLVGYLRVVVEVEELVFADVVGYRVEDCLEVADYLVEEVVVSAASVDLAGYLVEVAVDHPVAVDYWVVVLLPLHQSVLFPGAV